MGIYYIEEKKLKKHYRDNLKELNENNTELYINDEKMKYEKYFIPKKDLSFNNIKIEYFY